MQIICISRGSQGYGTELAEKLSQSTGYATISRETITDKATEYGIPVGKLEMEILRNRPLSEEMSIVADMYKAFATAQTCERALNENIIYHSRMGHLALPGLARVMRIRAIAEPEYRIKRVMDRLKITRKKAKDYIDHIDEDTRKWTHILYNADLSDTSKYDLTLNATNLSAENAAKALASFAQLPEFQETPSTFQDLQDLLLAANCRLAIGSDDRSRSVNVGIQADKGNVSVTYMPRQSKEAKTIPDVLKSIKGIKSLVCTVATTNVLYLAEKFNPDDDHFLNLIEIAEKWNAAIEIVRIADKDEKPTEAPLENKQQVLRANQGETGGILEDSESPIPSAEPGVGISETVDKLIQVGHSGGARTIYGGTDALLRSLSKTEQYSLVAIGDVFSSKGAAAQRMKREMLGKLKDKFRVPVIGTEDLKAKYLFGPKQLFNMIGFAVLFALIYLIAFNFQEPILTFISKGQFGGTVYDKAFSALAVVVCVPIVAFSIGGFFSNFLKLLKVE